MTNDQKKDKIKEYVKDMIQKSQEKMMMNLDKVLESGAINIEEWDAYNCPMIIPACITNALLEYEMNQRDFKGSSFEKEVKKQTKNIGLFI